MAYMFILTPVVLLLMFGLSCGLYEQEIGNQRVDNLGIFKLIFDVAQHTVKCLLCSFGCAEFNLSLLILSKFGGDA